MKEHKTEFRNILKAYKTHTKDRKTDRDDLV
jgi:hypothetical protein